jgi:hypothetical protein
MYRSMPIKNQSYTTIAIKINKVRLNLPNESINLFILIFLLINHQLTNNLYSLNYYEINIKTICISMIFILLLAILMSKMQILIKWL